MRDGVFIVTCKVRDGKGRTDVTKGAVSITGLKGDALANAMMKAETKAKAPRHAVDRRPRLSG